MRQLNYLKSLSLASLSCFLLGQTAHAATVSPKEEINDADFMVSPNGDSVMSASMWLSQAITPDEADEPDAHNTEEEDTVESPIQITDVQLLSTEFGFSLLLETLTGELLSIPVSESIDQDFIADIPNSSLSLTDSEQFQVTNPTDAIALITVSNQPNNQVRVVITGVSDTPVVNVSSDLRGLVFNIVPLTTTDAIATDALRIVVTAEKTPEIVQDVPISLTVLTEDDLEDADITRLDGIAGNVPNFSSFSATGSRSFTYYSIRGLSNQNFGSRDPVAFYVDDVPYDYGGFLDLDLPDLQQVEILRGPQNTLYGRSSQAGVVNITTRKPTNELSFNGAVSYGSEENVDLRAGVSGPIVENELFYRLSGSYGRRDGFYDNSFLDEEYDEQSGGTGRAQVRWTPADAWDISFNASVEEYRDGIFPFVALDDDDPFGIEQDFNGFSDLNTDSQSIRIAYLQPDFRVTSITTRRFSNQVTSGEIDRTIADVLLSSNDYESTVWTQELRLQSPEDTERWQWIVGGYFESRDFDNNETEVAFGNDAPAVLGDEIIPGSSTITTADSRDTTWAGFGQVSYRPIDPLSLTVGLRYEDTNSKLSSFQQFFRVPGFPDTILQEFNDVEQSTDAFLPRFAVDYRLSPEVTIYGTIARGYRPGGVNILADNAASLRFGAERSWNYEVGVKTTWLDDRLGVNFSFFHNPVTGYQVATFDPVTLFTDSVRNADVSITGLELDVRAIPLEGLTIIAGFGLTDAEFNDFTDPNTGTSFDNNSLPYAPDFTYNLAAQYRAPFGLFARLELQGIGQTFFDIENEVEQGSYAVVNTRLGYEFDQYGIYVFANNLFDTRYIAQGFNIDGTQGGSFGEPATYGVQLKASF
ncbi:MAG: TonB-dependent receptor [Cyanothece sp. SIO2G6]|nr:TonB-dependent receptor [Cyanothece sp. SIO2G6]